MESYLLEFDKNLYEAMGILPESETVEDHYSEYNVDIMEYALPDKRSELKKKLSEIGAGTEAALNGAFVIYATRIWEKVMIFMELVLTQQTNNAVYVNLKNSLNFLESLLNSMSVHPVLNLNEDYLFMREGPFKQLIHKYLTTDEIHPNWFEFCELFFADIRLDLHNLYEYLLKMQFEAAKTHENVEVPPPDAAMGV